MEYKKEPIKGFEKYEIDTNGNVYNSHGKLLKGSLSNCRYKSINFSVKGKIISKRVNRLVALQFIPNPDNKPEVNHIDGNKLNNKVENLEWVTSQENVWHSVEILNHNRRKPIIGIDKKTNEIKYKFTSLSEGGKYFSNNQNYRYSQNCIYRALKGISKSYKGCYWKYQ